MAGYKQQTGHDSKDQARYRVANELILHMTAHGNDGYCVKSGPDTYMYTIREHWRVPFRGFDCRNNEQWHVWEDYEQRILNLELMERVDRDC